MVYNLHFRIVHFIQGPLWPCLRCLQVQIKCTLVLGFPIHNHDRVLPVRTIHVLLIENSIVKT
jgi:hypothetical protein